jgi:hypothetical protein
VGPTEPHVQRVLRDISPGLNFSGPEARHSSLPSAEIKNGGNIALCVHEVVLN